MKAPADDRMGVVALRRSGTCCPSQPSSRPWTDSELALARLLERDPNSLLLVEGDEIIGSLIVGWDGWRGSFYRLAVHPEWCRQGIASALIRAGEERLQALGARRLTAIIADGEYAAAALWDAAGYRRQIGMSRFVRMVGATLNGQRVFWQTFGVYRVDLEHRWIREVWLLPLDGELFDLIWSSGQAASGRP